jgi:hypothetical protein
MPEGEPKPEPKESPTGVWSFGWKVLGMSPEAQRGAIAVGLTVFLVWMVVDDRQRGRAADDEFRAMMLRTVESEGVRNREANTAEGDKNRQTVDQIGKMTLASHQKLAAELGKLEARLADANLANQELTRQVQHLGSMIAKWKKDDPPHPEAELAPMPKLWDAAPVKGGRPTIG